MLSAAAGAQLTPQPMGSTVPRAGPVQHEGLYLNSQVNNQATRLAAPAAQHQSPVITAFQNRQQPASSHPQQQHAAAEPYPEAVGIFCNGNHGVYLVNRRGVQCLCKVCQENRRNNPNTDLWLVSPTEFERHSGMSSAKKWRSSIRVSHQGEPDTTLGRWLDARGLGQKAPSKANSSGGLDLRPPAAAAAPPRAPPSGPAAAEGVPIWADQCSKQQRWQLPDHNCREQPSQDQLSQSADQLNHLLLLQQWDHQAKQQLQPASGLTADLPLCTSTAPPAPPPAAASMHPAAARPNGQNGTLLHDPPAIARSPAATAAAHVQPVNAYSGVTTDSTNKRVDNSRAAASSSVGAQLKATEYEQLLQAGPYDGVAHVTSLGVPSSSKKQQQQQQYELQQYQQQQRRPSSGRVSPASAAAMAAAASQAAAEAETAAANALGQAYQQLPHHQQQQQQQQQETIRAAAPSPLCIGNSRSPDNAVAAAVDDGPVDLEEAAAAAAQGDDSLWLRSPRRRTTPASIPMPSIVSVAVAAAAGSSDPTAATLEALRRLLMRGSAAAPPPPAAAPAAAVAVCKDTVQQQQQQREDIDMADAAVSGADGGDEVIGIAVGPQYQADLPQVRELPPVGHRIAMMELRKAGQQGPSHAAAVAMAIEEKARADLLPRDAIEDVWQRSSGIALERAPRQRRAPGWQSGFIDPLKPYSLTGGPPGQQGAESAGRISNPGGMMTNADLAEQGYYNGGRKRGNGSSSSGFEGWDQEQQQQFGKRARFNGVANGGRAGPAGSGFMLGGVNRKVSSNHISSAAFGHPAYCCDDPNCPNTMAAAAAMGSGAAGGWGAPVGYNGPTLGPELLNWCLITPAMTHDGGLQGNQGMPAVLQNPGASPAGADPNPSSSQTAAAAAALEPTPRGSRASSEVPAALPAGSGAAAAEDCAAAPAACLESSTAPAPGGMQLPAAASSIRHISEGSLEVQTGYDATAATDIAAAAAARPAPAAAAAPPAVQAAANAETPAAPTIVSSSSCGVVEVRIVLDGCVYLGQLSEVQRVEMARSGIPAAVDPITKSDVHSPPAANTVCALCHMPEAPGCHADQASAIPSTGMSVEGLGPLMPVSMGLPVAAAAPPPAAAGVEYQQQQGDANVVWVHRQCALWSPEAYPDSRGILMHLPMAISRGRATRCSRCGERGATLKCGDRSCLQQYHLECARQAGCTLIAEPYTVTCPIHEPTGASPSHPGMAQQQQQHPNLGLDLKLHCRTGRPMISDHHGQGHTPSSAIAAAVAAARAAEGLDPEDLEPQPGDLIRSDRWGPMFGSDHPDYYGSDSDLTPMGGPMFVGSGSGRVLDDVIEAEDEMSAAAVLLSGFKQSRPMQSRLRYQSDDGDAYHAQHQHHLQQRRYHSETGDYQYLDSPLYHLAAAGGGGGYFRRSTHGSRYRAYGSRSSAAAAAAAAAARNRGSFGSQQMHDSRGRFMSHAAAKAAQEAAATRGPGSAAAGDVTTDSGGSPWTGAVSDSQQQQQHRANSPAAAAADEAANGSDMSSIEIPMINGEVYLGGTTGQPGRAGRCAVCVVQRKGKCGTESAPKKCLRRVLQQQRRAQAAAAAVAAKQTTAAGSSIEVQLASAAVDTDNSNTAAASGAGGAASAVDVLVAAEAVSPMEAAAAAVVCDVPATAVQA